MRKTTLPRLEAGGAPARAAALLLLLAAAACGDSKPSEPPRDTAAPTVQIQSPSNNFLTAGGVVTVSGTAADDRGVARVAYQVNGGAETEVAVTAGPSVAFTFPVTLAAGQNALVVHAVDQAGNRSSATVGGVLDGVAPVVQVASLAAQSVVIVPSVALQGTVSDNGGVTRVTYQVNGGAETEVPITPGPSAGFNVPLALQMGSTAVVVNAYDAAGNRGQVQRAVERREAGEARVTVLDPAGAPVADAQIVAAPQATAAGVARQAAVTYAPDGLYGVEYLGNGTYRVLLATGMGFALQVARGGHVTATYNAVVVVVGTATFLEPVRLVPAGSTAPGVAAGQVLDAFTGQPLAGVALTLRAGLNAAGGPVAATGTTSATGAYTFPGLAPGYYTVQMTRAGYATGYFTVTVTGGQTSQHFGSIAPTVGDAQVRIILDWGATPFDLDSHFTGPAEVGTSRFHVAFYDMAYLGPDSALVAALDRDDVSSYGPETVTLYRQRSGRYRYSVHDFSNRNATSSTALGNSGARVRVYRGSTLARSFFVPAGQPGTLWTVFELDGTTIIPVNQMSYDSTPMGGTVPPGAARAPRTKQHAP